MLHRRTLEVEVLRVDRLLVEDLVELGAEVLEPVIPLGPRAVIPEDRLWVNPDCGLKTRGWEETEAALRNMIAAARELRQRVASPREAVTSDG